MIQFFGFCVHMLRYNGLILRDSEKITFCPQNIVTLRLFLAGFCHFGSTGLFIQRFVGATPA
jgi:hypothetical protein